jgi:hypothetical protein
LRSDAKAFIFTSCFVGNTQGTYIIEFIRGIISHHSGDNKEFAFEDPLTILL